MEYSEQQLQEFKEQYARKRRHQYLISGGAILIAVAIGLLSGRWRSIGAIRDQPIYLGLLFAVLIALVVYSLRNWRCPACGSLLGRSYRLNFCPNCGVELR